MEMGYGLGGLGIVGMGRGFGGCGRETGSGKGVLGLGWVAVRLTRYYSQCSYTFTLEHSDTLGENIWRL